MRIVFVGRDRPVWKGILLSLVTLSISRRLWLRKVNKEIDGHDALGLRHGAITAMLACAIGAPLWLWLASSLGLPTGLYALALLFLLPTGIVSYQTATRIRDMLSGSGIRHGAPWLITLPGIIPVLGGLWFLSWEQSRLNRFWAYERGHPEHGIEVDLSFEDVPGFVVEMREAQKASYFATSRFQERRRLRPIVDQRLRDLEDVHTQRRQVRERGGSTPILPWQRPKAPPIRHLAITCGRCEHRFEVRQDPLEETVILCPSCGLSEVMPALWQNPLATAERPMKKVNATCPACDQAFHALPDAAGALVCPHCGHAEGQPVPAKAKRSATKAAKPTKAKASGKRSSARRA